MRDSPEYESKITKFQTSQTIPSDKQRQSITAFQDKIAATTYEIIF